MAMAAVQDAAVAACDMGGGAACGAGRKKLRETMLPGMRLGDGLGALAQAEWEADFQAKRQKAVCAACNQVFAEGELRLRRAHRPRSRLIHPVCSGGFHVNFEAVVNRNDLPETAHRQLRERLAVARIAPPQDDEVTMPILDSAVSDTPAGASSALGPAESHSPPAPSTQTLKKPSCLGQDFMGPCTVLPSTIRACPTSLAREHC